MKKRIVIIEDDSIYGELLKRTIQQIVPEWTVEIAPTMQEGRELCATHVDLIVLDLALPDCPASMTISMIVPLSHSAPVIVLTGKELRDSHIAAECYRCGASDVWEKTAFHNGGSLFFIHCCNSAIQRHEARHEHATH